MVPCLRGPTQRNISVDLSSLQARVLDVDSTNTMGSLLLDGISVSI